MILIGLFTLVLALGARALSLPFNNAVCENDPNLFTLAKDTDTFAVNLYKQALETQRSDNVFFSPASISIATSMLYNGANRETAEQINRAAFPNVQVNAVDTAYTCLLRSINNFGRKFDLDTANGLFADAGFSIKQSYIELLTSQYQSIATNLPFRQAPEQARNQINQFVAEKTRNRINELLPTGSVDASTAMVLVNAIYFKGTWSTPFQTSSTQRSLFTGLDQSQDSQVDLMEIKFGEFDNNQDFTYTEDESLGVQVLGLPYTAMELTMYVILPRETRGLRALEERLDGITLRNLIQRVVPIKMERVAIPKFKVSHRLPLKDILQKLGITNAFSANADLSKISDGQLKVSDALHQAFVEVNEEGTEAAAATSFGGTGVSGVLGLPPRRPSFVADHPFTYVIQHNPTKTILFLGRFVHPGQN